MVELVWCPEVDGAVRPLYLLETDGVLEKVQRRLEVRGLQGDVPEGV